MVENVVAKVERGEGISAGTTTALNNVITILDGINLTAEHESSMNIVKQCETEYTTCDNQQSTFWAKLQAAGSTSQCGAPGYTCPLWNTTIINATAHGNWSFTKYSVPSGYTNMADAREVHRACRNKAEEQCIHENDLCIEYYTYLNSSDALFPRCAVKKDQWNTAYQHGTQYDDGTIYALPRSYMNSPDCEASNEIDGCLKSAYISANWWKKDRMDMENCLDAVNRWHRKIWPKYIACRDGAEGGGLDFSNAPAGLLQEKVAILSPVIRNASCEDQLNDCDDKQLDFEEKYCTWTEKRVDACKAHKTCFNSAMSTCATNCNTAKLEAEVRKNEYTTIQKIKCFIFVILNHTEEHTVQAQDDGVSNKTEDLDACKNLEATLNLDQFNVACVGPLRDSSNAGDARCHYKDWAGMDFTPQATWGFDCAVTPRPCDADFNTTEYYWIVNNPDWDWENAPLAPCTTCTQNFDVSDLTDDSFTACNTGPQITQIGSASCSSTEISMQNSTHAKCCSVADVDDPEFSGLCQCGSGEFACTNSTTMLCCSNALAATEDVCEEKPENTCATTSV